MKMQEERKYIYLLKAFAIFSTVCAHNAVLPEGANKAVSMIIWVMICLGTYGVPLFFFISGYLFYSNKYTVKKFVIRKIKTIVIPWFFCATIVWLYVVLRKGGLSFLSWIEFIIGKEYSTYYMTMLLVLYVIYWKTRRYDWFIYGSIFLSVIAIIGQSWFGWGWTNWLNPIAVKPHFNPLNWAVYFALGMIVKKKCLLGRTSAICRKYLWLWCSLLMISAGIHYVKEIPWTYYSRYVLINIPLMAMIVMGICRILVEHNAEFLQKIGEYSFTIYLLHALGAGGIVWFTERLGWTVLILLRPFINIALVLAGIYVIRTICNRCRRLRGIPEMLIGIR